MTEQEKNLMAGHAVFHNAVRPILEALITSEKEALAIAKSNLGLAPNIIDYENITETEQAALDAYNASQQPIRLQERSIRALEVAHGNKRRNAANEYYQKVADVLYSHDLLNDITGVSAHAEAMEQAVGQITASELDFAVLTVYNDISNA